MNPIALFQLLKNDVLLTYKKHFPYFEGNWKRFSSQDISNLIDQIEKSSNQRISEKWIYTHLKPDENHKLPRKDMLDILSQFAGFSSWDEYAFKHKEVAVPIHDERPKEDRKIQRWIIGIVATVVILSYLYRHFYSSESKTITVKNALTNEKIDSGEVKAFVVENDTETAIKIVDSKIDIPTQSTIKVILRSPYYKDKIVVANKTNSEVTMQPDDYAMMLKAFMKSDIKNWQTRKKQLQKILADDAEILVILKDNVGFEYFNKEEFSEKLIVPTASLKKMKVIEIQHNDKNEINFIRIIQE